MKILVTGSIAYDTIMVFPDRFRNHLLADQLHILNVCFLTPEMRREYGGTAGNIGYNLKLLGEEPRVMASVGDDIAPYAERFARLGIGTQLFRRIPGQFTAQAFITTDLDDNQITAFHPGAMNFAHETQVSRELGASLAIIGPDGKEGMIQHARQCAELGVPFIFDPGQGLPMFSAAELETFLRQASYVADVSIMPRWLRVSDAVAYYDGVHPAFDRAATEKLLERGAGELKIRQKRIELDLEGLWDQGTVSILL